MTALPVILDCDPGIDDAVSLLVALASPENFNILGITTVAGNVDLDTCTRNACQVRELAGRMDVPVYAGCPRPMVIEPVFADHIHGDSGLGRAQLPEPSHMTEDQHAVDFIIETLLAADDDSITLVPTGPLTNIAVAITRSPEILPKIKQLIIMGGARSEGGNITPSAEFNIAADPHAAHVVYRCGRPILAMGLDATMQFRASPARMDVLRGIDSETGRAVMAMLEHVNDVYVDFYGEEGAAIHDPCTIGYLLAPELFTTRPCAIAVEMSSPLTLGHTAVNLRVPDPDTSIEWVTQTDASALFDLIVERLKRL